MNYAFIFKFSHKNIRPNFIVNIYNFLKIISIIIKSHPSKQTSKLHSAWDCEAYNYNLMKPPM